MKRPVNLKRFFSYALIFASAFCLAHVAEGYPPFPLALVAACAYVGANPLLTAALCFAPYILSADLTVIAVAAFGSVVLGGAFFAFGKIGRKPKFDLALYVAFAAAPYAPFGKSFDLPTRIALVAVTTVLAYIFISGARVWLVKRLKYKLSVDELLSAAVILAATGYGLVNVFGETPWKCLSVFVILFSTALAPYGYAVYVATALSLPLAFHSLSFTPIAIFAVYAAVAAAFGSFSRLLSAIAIAGTELLLYFFTAAYEGIGYEVLFILLPVTVFAFFPTKYFDRVRADLRVYRSPALGRAAINRSRAALSGKLYEIAGVFDEMNGSVETLRKSAPTEREIKRALVEKTISSACSECPSREKCSAKGVPYESDVEKTVSLGMAKGKINLVDLPKTLSDSCDFEGDFVAAANCAVAAYLKRAAEESIAEKGRELLACQSSAIAQALKKLALPLAMQAEYDSALEDKIASSLAACGVGVAEISVYQSAETEIDMVVPSSAANKAFFIKAIDETTGYKSVIVNKTNLSSDLTALTLRRAPLLDAAFGVAQKVKDGEKASGDTHSVTKISEREFLFALSDGMGSGKDAERTSSAATSLIETFYRAGLGSESVLKIVNKLLSYSRDDNFTATDICIVDLVGGEADFIKIGSPYSFVITSDSVKIIEGNSLPLGILDEMNPTVCRTTLKAGDVVLFVSDGISDAFGSAADIIDFLSTERALNPKVLADNVLNKALSLTFGEARDDMTAFCVRLFERK